MNYSEILEFKQIGGHPDYLVSNNGDVISMKSRRFLTPIVSGRYLAVKLWTDRKHKSKAIHRLVLETFSGECPEGMEASHLDGDGFNSRLDNLVWETHQENVDRKKIHGTNTVGENHPMRKLTNFDVKRIRQMLKEGVYGQIALASMFKVSRSMISAISTRKNWKHVD